MSKFIITMEVDADFIPDGISKDVQDLFMKHYQDLNEIEELDGILTPLGKHHAMIAVAILKGETEFVEGYGHLKNIIRDISVQVIKVEEQ